MSGGGSVAKAPIAITSTDLATHPLAKASAEMIRLWGDTAQPGDEIVYHEGAFLVKQLPTVRAADALIAAGEALPIQQKLGPSLFQYRLQKRRNAERVLSAAKAGNRGAATGFTVDDEEVEQLMAVLRRLANFSKRCPPYRELAELAQLRGGPEAARYRMKLLVKAERIRVHTPDEGPLVVTIVSSGRSTAK